MQRQEAEKDAVNPWVDTTTSAAADQAAVPAYTSSAPSKIVSWAVPVEDVFMQPQPGEQTGMGLGKEESSMDTSSDSTRKSATNEPDEDQEGLESKKG